MAQPVTDLSASDPDAAPAPAALQQWSAVERRLVELAASDCDDVRMRNLAADLLAGALCADCAVVYQISSGPADYAATARAGAGYEDHPGEDATPPPGMERRMRAAARDAARRAGTVARYHTRPRAGRPALYLVALVVGVHPARAAFVAAVPEDAVEQASSALEALRPALAGLVHSAHLRRELDRSARRQSQLQAIFTHSSEAVLTVDRDFTILEGNPALSSLLELREATPVGLHCSQVLRCHDERGQLLCGTAQCPLAQVFVLTNSAPYREVTWRTSAGKSKEVSASFAAVPSPEGVRGVIIARDMSPVNAANRMRSNFISMVSHELRNPLNSINGFLEIVLEGHVGTLTTRQEEFLEYARMSTHQLMTLVEDILFISRADTGQFKLRFASVSISELTA